MNTNLAHVDSVAQPLLELHDIRKRFGGTVALAGVTLSVAPGEVHGLIGENGAGKSTLIKVLCGIVKPDSGAITLAGEAYSPHMPRDAKARGLQVVHQEFNLLPFLSVAENIFIEHLPRNALGVVKRRDMNTRARAALDAIGLKDIDVRWPVERLGIAHRQLVEVARALMTESRVLILDEPTATLTSRETERLFAIIDDLRRRGVSIIFVSHHLDEVFKLCDRVTVLRNGETVTSRRIGETTQDELVRAMVGQQLQKEMTHSTASSARSETVLSLVNFRHAQSPHEDGISFDLHKGEILGIAGLVGSGRTELLRAIFAAEPPLSGTLMRDGKPAALRSPPRCDPRGNRVRHRRPQGRRADPVDADRRQRHDGLFDRCVARGPARSKGRKCPDRKARSRSEAEIWGAWQKRRDALGRQPAEGGSRQMARAEAGHPAVG
ncbi:hypothetical protein AB395_00001793 [Sinorhizobium fredii CCBAU 45436]|nr:hypothetical protein AB395_00001793 [Sinorhizobium fredii CCBAU 45436]